VVSPMNGRMNGWMGRWAAYWEQTRRTEWGGIHMALLSLPCSSFSPPPYPSHPHPTPSHPHPTPPTPTTYPLPPPPFPACPQYWVSGGRGSMYLNGTNVISYCKK
jgi:hypothetical protein